MIAFSSAAAVVGTILLSGCGDSKEASKQALDGVVTGAGFEILESGENRFGAMLYDKVAVGPNCVAEVWSQSNDADLKDFAGEAPIQLQVFTNTEASADGEPFTAARYNAANFPTFEELIARPLVSHLCSAE